MTRLGIGFILTGLLVAGGSPNLSGKWDVQVEGYGAPRTQKFELKQNGEDLSGIYAGKFGESKVSGTVKDAAVDFEMRVIENEHIITVHYTGTAADEGIKGTVTFGNEGKGTWVASRGTTAHKK
ncbi:MAG: hypothetical protein ABSF22_24700 [Bryobacteraceae bacterium]|jgi:hypothetical protein